MQIFDALSFITAISDTVRLGPTILHPQVPRSAVDFQGFLKLLLRCWFSNGAITAGFHQRHIKIKKHKKKTDFNSRMFIEL